MALLALIAVGLWHAEANHGENPEAHKPYIMTPLPQCHFHVFRHISKAAGTTMRFIFDKQVVMGDWEFRPRCEFGFGPGEWAEVVSDFRAAVKEGRPDGPRVVVEIRNGWGATNYATDILPALEKLRADMEGTGCKVTSSFLMREPKAQTISFYRYYILKMQKMKDGGPPGGPRGPIAWGNDFLDWIQQPADENIQVREILGDKCTPLLRASPFAVAEGPGGKGTLKRIGPRELLPGCSIEDEDVERFKRIIDSFDVVGTTTNFNSFWLRVADAAGFQHLEYTQGNKAAGPKEGHNQWKTSNLPAEWVTALGKATARDEEGFEYVTEVEKRQIADAHTSFQGRLELYEGMTAEKARRQFIGGEPPDSPLKWVARCPPDELERWGERCKGGGPGEQESLQPAFYTGRALCGRGTMEVVLARKDAEWRCARGCTFD